MVVAECGVTNLMLASFPGLLHLQFLIACSRAKTAGVEGLGMRLPVCYHHSTDTTPWPAMNLKALATVTSFPGYICKLSGSHPCPPPPPPKYIIPVCNITDDRV